MTTSEIGTIIAIIGVLSAVPSWWLSNRLLGDKIEIANLKSKVSSLEETVKEIKRRVEENERTANRVSILEERVNNHLKDNK